MSKSGGGSAPPPPTFKSGGAVAPPAPPSPTQLNSVVCLSVLVMCTSWQPASKADYVGAVCPLCKPCSARVYRSLTCVYYVLHVLLGSQHPKVLSSVSVVYRPLNSHYLVVRLNILSIISRSHYRATKSHYFTKTSQDFKQNLTNSHYKLTTHTSNLFLGL